MASINPADKEILEKLTIREPQSTNPILFSNMAPMNYTLASFLRKNLMREVTVEEKAPIAGITWIDLRAALWLRTYERLHKEKEFADNRYAKAAENYEAVSEADDASPEELDNAEGLMRRMFEKKLQSDSLYDEFKTFLDLQGLLEVDGTMTGTEYAFIVGRLKARYQENKAKATEEINRIGDNAHVRTYQLIHGEYIDQYGVTLHDFVRDVTDHPESYANVALSIPILENPADDVASQVMIVRNPVYYGRSIHPPSFMFEERLTMDVEWKGIGLGEFSHSINLFPGEERELQIVTTKKRSWETVSKTAQISKSAATSESTTASKRNDSFESKLHDAFESSSTFKTDSSSSGSRSSTTDVSGGAGFGIGPFSLNFKAGHSSTTSSNSSSSRSSSLSSVAKNARDLAAKTSSEVSQNNKVTFNSSTELQQNLEEKVTAEDSESETQKIKLRNINEGKTVNYNFFQVTNIYGTEIRAIDLKLHISTGIEIIRGTGLTIGKTYDIEDFAQILHDFRIYGEADRKEIVKAIMIQVLDRYLFIDGEDAPEDIDDDPQVVRIRNGSAYKQKILRNRCRQFDFESLQPVDGRWVLPYHNELLKMAGEAFFIAPIIVPPGDGESGRYTVNSGKYFVDALIGIQPATEEYLETRREIETEKQRALVDELKARTELGVFFPELPGSITTLSMGEDDLTKTGADGQTKTLK